MGVQSLLKIMSSFVPEAFNKIDYNTYSGKTVAIDVSNLLYYRIGYLKKKGKYNDLSHIRILLKDIVHLMKNNIKPIFVFDGKCSPVN